VPCDPRWLNWALCLYLWSACGRVIARGQCARRNRCRGTVFEESFMGPAELRSVFLRAALNIHPSLADAYGMTIVRL